MKRGYSGSERGSQLYVGSCGLVTRALPVDLFRFTELRFDDHGYNACVAPILKEKEVRRDFSLLSISMENIPNVGRLEVRTMSPVRPILPQIFP